MRVSKKRSAPAKTLRGTAKSPAHLKVLQDSMANQA